MELQLSIERDEITLYFRSLYDKRKRNWYQFSLISKLLGREAVVGIMDESNSAFFADNMDEIMKRFRKEFAVTTIKQLDELKAERSKRM